MKRILMLLALAPFALPAFAQPDDLPCSGFAAMAPEEQETTLTAMRPDPNDPPMDEVVTACSENPDMSLADAVEEARRN